MERNRVLDGDAMRVRGVKKLRVEENFVVVALYAAPTSDHYPAGLAPNLNPTFSYILATTT